MNDRMIEDGEWETIGFERDGDVLVVTIDHPRSDLNAVDAQLHHELGMLFRELRRERTARSVLLTGRGQAFCAGGDLDWFPQLRTAEALDALRLDARQMIWDLLDVELPLVCALNGHAMGLGASLALLCDVIVASEDARIGDPHVRVGLVAGDGGTVIWPLVLGPARAKEHLLLGDPLTATDAERLGLVNRVVAQDEVRPVAMGLARRLAASAPLAVRYTKLAVNQQLRAALLVSFDTATALELATFASEDHAEAIQAAVEKREPRCRGRRWGVHGHLRSADRLHSWGTFWFSVRGGSAPRSRVPRRCRTPPRRWTRRWSPSSGTAIGRPPRRCVICWTGAGRPWS